MLAEVILNQPLPSPSHVIPQSADASRASQESPPAIAGFTDLVEVGRGASGRVYRAWQGSLRRVVALKVMTSNVTAESIGRAHARRGRWRSSIIPMS